ncbi:MAG: TetR/AcrR family transcriptional regulator [Acidimicrobiales bacterium]
MIGTDALLDRIASSLGGAAPPDQDPTGHAILDATLDTIAAVGLAGLSLDAIARRASCNRTTIYRRFTDRDGLLVALAEREAHRMADELRRSIEGATDPAELLCEAFVTSVRLAIAHPLVARARQHEPEALLAALAFDGSRVLRIGGAAVGAALRHAASQGSPSPVDPDAAGLAAARLLASFLLTPGPDLDVNDPADVRRYAQEVLTPLLLGHRAGGAGEEAR